MIIQSSPPAGGNTEPRLDWNVQAKSGLPLSGSQLGIWFAQRLRPNSAAYNIGEYIEIRGAIAPALFERALRQVVGEAEALRVRIFERDGEPLQIIEEDLAWTLPAFDFSSKPDPHAAAEAWMRSDLATPVDPTEGPLFRFALFKVAGDTFYWYARYHHIVMDGLGMGLVARRVAEVYTALGEGRPACDGAFGSLRVLLEEDAEYRASDRVERDRAFWREYLAGEPAAVRLGGEAPAEPDGVIRKTGYLERTFVEKLEKIADDAGTGLPQLLSAAVAIYLHRLTGERDLVLGLPVSVRRGAARHVPGMVSNVVPLRMAVTPSMTVGQVLGEAASQIRLLLPHQRYQLSELRRDVGRTDEGGAWFGVSANIMRSDQDFLFGEQGAVTHNLSLGPVEDVSIAFYLHSNRGPLRIDFDSNPALHVDVDIASRLKEILRLLRSMTSPDASLSALDILSGAERRRVLEEFNATAHAVSPGTLPGLFAAQALRTPDAVAAVYEDRALSYAALDAHANRLAHHLAGQGVGPESIVALCVERSLEMVIGLIGILKAGAAYLPLDPSYPAERLGFMLKDAGASVLVTQQSLLERLAGPGQAGQATAGHGTGADGTGGPGAGGPGAGGLGAGGLGAGGLGAGVANTVRLDADWGAIALEPAHAPQIRIEPGHPAYVIYTSGSTGTPKGVVVEHGGIPNLAIAQIERFAITAQSRVLQFASPSFDAAVSEIATAFLSGATLVLPSPDQRGGEALALLIVEQHITHATLPPVLLGDLSPDLPLQSLIVAGEACSPATVTRWSTGRRMINAYGPTEGTVCATMSGVLSGGDGDTAPPIGSPIWNTRVYVLDGGLQPCPVGVLGELYISGLGLARGYLGRFGLTGERFVADPYGVAGSRMYRTGDLARWRPEGVLDFAGRADSQIKLRGFRIEPGEIEAALLSQDGIAQAAVVVRGTDQRRLIGYVVAGAGCAVDPSALRAALCGVLPDYMVPSAIVVLDALPLTPNGKLDRRALPEPAVARGGLLRLPRTPQEEVLCGLFAEVLGAGQVGIDDNFFELGGHSLLATRLISRIRSSLEVEVSIRSLFEAPSVAGLAGVLSDAEGARAPLRAQTRPAELPLSYAQRRLWFLERLEGPSATYTIPLAVRLEGELDRSALEGALWDLIDRHESLRTVYPERGGVPRQEILPSSAVRPGLAVLPVGEAGLAEALSSAAGRGFDLAAEPPLRAQLYALPDGEHVLLLLLHHIAGDGWSLSPLWRDVARFYAARRRSEAAGVTPLAVQYADYTLWQRTVLGDESDPQSALSRQLTYWTERLAGLPEQLDLPSDRPRPAVASHRGASVAVELPAPLHAGMVALARECQASVFMVLQAGLAALLSRLGAGTDIAIGSPIAGRTDEALDDLVGFFVNTLVLRTDLSGRPSLRELIGRVRAASLAAYSHQDVPFERLVEVINPARSLSRHPLFQVMLAFQNNAGAELGLEGVTARFEPVATTSAKFDLALSLAETRSAEGAAAGIAGTLEYATDLFDRTGMELLVARLVRLLEASVGSPDASLSALDILSGAERRRVLEEFNATAHAVSPGTLPGLFAAQALRTPDAVAAVYEDRALSYAALDAHANRLAHHLAGQGVGPESIVALCVERSLEMVIGLIGILKAGAAYLPLDPSYPAERLGFMLKDAGASVLVTQQSLLERLAGPGQAGQATAGHGTGADGTGGPGAGGPGAGGLGAGGPGAGGLGAGGLGAGGLGAGVANTVRLDADWGAIALEPAHAPQIRIEPGHPAYVIYTSGSTGTPKGVVVEHGALLNFLRAMQERFALSGGDRLLAVTTIGFDIAALELYLPLICGASVAVAPSGTVKDVPALARLIGTSGAGAMQATPTLWQALASHIGEAASHIGEAASHIGEAASPAGEAGSAASDVLRGLRMLVGGEALGAGLAQTLQLLGGAVTNLYGPTETTVWSAAMQLEGALPDDAAAPPIGSPIWNTRVYVLDGGLQPCPVGVLGELYISGLGLARGYLGRFGLTGERFVADPYGVAGSRMYRTGDLARWRPEGVLDFAGRADSQIKLRGFRIEPGEIEAALLSQDGIAQAAVVVRGTDQRRLIGYVVAGAGCAVDPSALRAALCGVLPDYMVPSAIVVLDALPLTPNGKLDRRALPEPAVARGGLLRLLRLPRTPQEEVLCGLFAEVLGAGQVGIDDNFFELGGHSLLATRLISRIRSSLEVEVSIRSLFEAPSVAGLAGVLSDAEGARAPLRAQTRPAELPLSYAQRRLWFLERLEGPSATYTIPLAVRLEGELDRSALEGALWDLIDRHESLRTVYPERGGVPRQEILPSSAVRPGLAVLPVGEAGLAEALSSAAGRGFDLAAEPPLRAQLYALPDGEHVLLLLLHHIAGDGWSLSPLWRDVARFYAARRRSEAAGVTPLAVQYADYTLWQRTVLGDESDPQSALSRQLTYWTERLAGLPEQLDLPSDRPRPAVASHRGASVAVELPAPLHAGMVALARECQASVFMVLQAGLAALLSRLGAGTDIAIGSPIAGRTDEALDDLVGFFVNTLVLRTDLSGRPSLRELIGRVRAASLAAYSHQDVPFERLVEVINPARSLSRHPLFQVMLAFQNNAGAELGLEGVTARFEPVATTSAKFDLALSLAETRSAEGAAAGIAGTLEYATDLFDRTGMELLVARLVRLLEASVGSPDASLSALDILSGAERRRVLEEFNATAHAVSPGTLPGLFAAQALRTPDAVAAVYEDRALSYAALDAHANRLAHHLAGQGVGPESIVALCVERSLEMVIGLIGILKAGAAYLPLDPSYPAERLGFMLKDAGASVLVTQQSLLERLAGPGQAGQATAGHGTGADGTGGPGAGGPGAGGLGAGGPGAGGLGAGGLGAGGLGAGVANTVRLDADWGAIALEPAHAPQIRIEPGHPAYVIYTSGSTGTPKGVVVEHRSLVQKLMALKDDFDVGAGFRSALFIPAAFDASIEQALLPLIGGGSVVIISDDAREAPLQFWNEIGRHDVTFVSCVPSYLESIILHAPNTLYLKHLALGGEPFTTELSKTIARQLKVERVTNLYGPTETTIDAISFDVPQGWAGRQIPIGRPMPNYRVYVLDDSLQPVPPNVAGELYISGRGLARGYLGRFGLTGERFVADPYGVAGSRMYRTGDLARWRSDGVLDFAGRADSQIKLRGFRIEPGEIEAALLRQGSVVQAAVVVREDVPGIARLVAYIVPRGRNVDTVSLRAYASSMLPDYMVPSAIVVLDALPLTPNGKLDRRALPVPDLLPFSKRRAPRTPQEEILCGLFAEVLGLERVGIDENFFELGGHSLLAIRLISRIRSSLDVEIGIRSLFEAPNVEALAKRLIPGRPTRTDFEVLLPIRPAGNLPPLFCIHDAGGFSWPYSKLIRHLPAERPIYGLQARNLTQRERRPSSIEEMAADYLNLIQKIQPAGPYNLLGWSFGGLVAHAVATRLQSMGQDVSLLALLDSYPVENSETKSPFEGEFDLFSVQVAINPIRNLLDVLRREGLSTLKEHHYEAIMDTFKNNTRIARTFAPHRFNGDMLLFVATESEVKTPVEAWRSYVSREIQVHPVSCAHDNMMDPIPAEKIGAVLVSALERLDKNVNASGQRRGS